VCREALVLSFYRVVRPIDSFTPSTSNFITSSPEPLNFMATALQPIGHNLSVQWLTNGSPIPGAANSAFTIQPTLLGNGTNTVSARVTDLTPFVRTDTSNLLNQTIVGVEVRLPTLGGQPALA
jgi:hypothetical protein